MIHFEVLSPDTTLIAAKILGACYSSEVEEPFLQQEAPLLLSGLPFAPIMLMAKRADAYLGCGVLGVHGAYTISSLAVLPQYQGMGYGTEIVTYLTRLARLRTKGGVFLAFANRPCLWEKLGFEKKLTDPRGRHVMLKPFGTA